MAWEVEFTSRFETWWNSLSEDEQVEISAKVELLQERGPTLPRPHADVISTSRHANMKELRAKVEDKTGDPKWYEKFVPIADDLFDEHLNQLERKRQT